MCKNSQQLDAPAHLPGMRGYPLLRQFAQQACQQARAQNRPPGGNLRRARREMALVLCGRRNGRILNIYTTYADQESGY